MIDLKKRNLVKTLGAAVVLPSVLSPTLAHTSANSGSNTDSHHVKAGSLSVELQLGANPMMKVTNHGEKIDILRQIKGGVIQVNNKHYDLNGSLSKSAYGIGSGRSRMIPIKEISKSGHNSHQINRIKNRHLKSMLVSDGSVDNFQSEKTTMLYA